jgi:hypothetical protein
MYRQSPGGNKGHSFAVLPPEPNGRNKTWVHTTEYHLIQRTAGIEALVHSPAEPSETPHVQTCSYPINIPCSTLLQYFNSLHVQLITYPYTYLTRTHYCFTVCMLLPCIDFVTNICLVFCLDDRNFIPWFLTCFLFFAKMQKPCVLIH